MSFIVIEGLDGSGKSTQIHLLLNHFENKGIPFQYLHFPRTSAPVYGELIARFLRGEFGTLDSVNPYLVALLYAGDRQDAASMIQKWIHEKVLVLVDRYVYSNIAFQCAKISSPEESRKLADWIRLLEFSQNRIPVPDLSLFLDVPFGFTRNQLRKDRSGTDRSYLNGRTDIHESDLEFQQRVREIYLRELESDPSFVKIDCGTEKGEVLDPELIFKKIVECLNTYGIL